MCHDHEKYVLALYHITGNDNQLRNVKKKKKKKKKGLLQRGEVEIMDSSFEITGDNEMPGNDIRNLQSAEQITSYIISQASLRAKVLKTWRGD